VWLPRPCVQAYFIFMCCILSWSRPVYTSKHDCISWQTSHFAVQKGCGGLLCVKGTSVFGMWLKQIEQGSTTGACLGNERQAKSSWTWNSQLLQTREPVRPGLCLRFAFTSSGAFGLLTRLEASVYRLLAELGRVARNYWRIHSSTLWDWPVVKHTTPCRVMFLCNCQLLPCASL